MLDLSNEAPRVVDDALGRERIYDDGTLPAQAPRADESATRAFLAEIVAALEADGRAGDSPTPWQIPLPAAEALGRAWHAAGGAQGDLARETARLARSLRDALADLRLITPERDRRLSVLMGEATARAVEAHAAAGTGRRDGWLSFYAHELRNPLNTLVNAMWILRNQVESSQGQRVCDMAERAIKKLEILIKDVREMESKSSADSPKKV